MPDIENPVLKMDEISLFTVSSGSFYADLSLNKGGCYACIGKKDSGKTTLLRIITDLEPVYMGTLSLFGRSDKTGLIEGREKIGAFIDRPVGYEGLNIGCNLRVQRIATGKMKNVNMMEVFTGLDFTSKNTDRRRLSSQSMEQRLLYGIAAAFLNNPELLLLDEPFAGLDTDKRIRLAELLRLRCQRGMTALVTCHSLEAAVNTGIFTDYIFLSEGRVVKQLSSSELIELTQDFEGEHIWDKLQLSFETAGAEAQSLS